MEQGFSLSILFDPKKGALSLIIHRRMKHSIAISTTCAGPTPDGRPDGLQQILKYRLRPRLEEMLDLPVDLIIQDHTEPLTLVSKIALLCVAWIPCIH